MTSTDILTSIFFTESQRVEYDQKREKYKCMSPKQSTFVQSRVRDDMSLMCVQRISDLETLEICLGNFAHLLIQLIFLMSSLKYDLYICYNFSITFQYLISVKIVKNFFFK